jgi:hypothetical protein
MAKVFYTRKDLVSFGNYLLQQQPYTMTIGKTDVTHADVENWLEESEVVTKAIADEE